MARQNRNTPGQPLAAGDTSQPPDDQGTTAGDAEPTGETSDVHARLAHARRLLNIAHTNLSAPRPLPVIPSDRLNVDDDEDFDDEPVVAGPKVLLHVLKPFKFLSPKVGERTVAKGDQWFDPSDPNDAHFLNHPYITKHLADGAIEHPDVTKERLKAAADDAQKKAALHKQLLAEAEESFARFERNATINKGTSEDYDREMNTPLNQLPRR